MKNIPDLKASWNELKGRIKQKFAMLTQNERLFMEGKRDEMLSRIQIKFYRSTKRSGTKKFISGL